MHWQLMKNERGHELEGEQLGVDESVWREGKKLRNLLTIL